MITNRRQNQLGYAALIAIQLGSCYRAELDLSVYVKVNGGAATSAGDGALPARGLEGGGGQGDPGGDARGGEAGAAAAAGSGQGAGDGGGEQGGGGHNGGGGNPGGGESGRGGVAGDGGWTPINQGGACTDEPLTLEQEVCHLTEVKPSVKECSVADDASPTRFRGCYDGGCTVCTLHGELPGYPHYFDWHPCCSRNDSCSNHDYFYCNGLCPAPTEHDTVAPCGRADPNPG